MSIKRIGIRLMLTLVVSFSFCLSQVLGEQPDFLKAYGEKTTTKENAPYSTGNKNQWESY